MLIVWNEKFASNLLSHKIHGTDIFAYHFLIIYLENQLNVSKHTFFVKNCYGLKKLIYMHAYVEEKHVFSRTFSPPWRFATHRDPSCGAPFQKKPPSSCWHFAKHTPASAPASQNLHHSHEVLHHPPPKSKIFEPKDGGLIHMFFRFQPFIFRAVHCRLQILHLYGCNMKSIGSINDPCQDEVQIRPACFRGNLIGFLSFLKIITSPIKKMNWWWIYDDILAFIFTQDFIL